MHIGRSSVATNGFIARKTQQQKELMWEKNPTNSITLLIERRARERRRETATYADGYRNKRKFQKLWNSKHHHYPNERREKKSYWGHCETIIMSRHRHFTDESISPLRTITKKNGIYIIIKKRNVIFGFIFLTDTWSQFRKEI